MALLESIYTAFHVEKLPHFPHSVSISGCCRWHFQVTCRQTLENRKCDLSFFGEATLPSLSRARSTRHVRRRRPISRQIHGYRRQNLAELLKYTHSFECSFYVIRLLLREHQTLSYVVGHSCFAEFSRVGRICHVTSESFPKCLL